MLPGQRENLCDATALPKRYLKKTTARQSTTPAAVSYVIYWRQTTGDRQLETDNWRQTTSSVWEESKAVGEGSEASVVKVNKDDHVFAVGAGGIPVEAK